MNDLQAQLVQDTLCEKKVIGSILTYGGLYDHVAEVIDNDCFRDGKCLGIWDAMCEVRKRGEDIDTITVVAELAKQGSNIQPWEVVEISNSGTYNSEIDVYVARLKELSLRRKLWRLGQRLVEAGINETSDIDEVQQSAFNELDGFYGNNDGISNLTQAMDKLSVIISNNMSKGTATTGTKTGVRKIDEKGGLQGSDFIVIGGDTSMGKTSFALSLVKGVIESGEKCALYSMEMTEEQIAARMLSMKTGIPSNTIMYNGEIQPHELELIDSAKGVMPGDNLIIDEKSTVSLDSMLISIRNLVQRYGIKGAIIDYLQLINFNLKNTTKEQAVGDACRRFKNLAKELGIWICALSQLNRDTQNPVPTLSRLRDSGQIADAADVVMFVYRPEYYNRTFPQPFDSLTEEECKGMAMIDVAKGRNIGIFKFLMEFNASTTHFVDLSLDDPSYANEPVEEDAPF